MMMITTTTMTDLVTADGADRLRLLRLIIQDQDRVGDPDPDLEAHDQDPDQE